MEFGTAVAFAIAALIIISLVAGNQALLLAVIALPAIAALIVLIVSDIRFQILPDGAVIVLALAGLAASIARGSVLYDLGAALVIALFFASLWFFSRGTWMGFGDAKLALATSLAVGFPASIAAFLFSFWLGGIVGTLLIATGRKDMQSRIPFGPFLIAGALAAFVWAPAFFAYTGLSQFPIFESKSIIEHRPTA